MTGSATRGGSRQQHRTVDNKPSKSLSNDDNQKLFSLIGPRCQTLVSAVVQVYLADPPSLNRWNKRCCGVATLIKDNPDRSYFIRVYDIRNDKLIWEQELYDEFKYKTPRPHFHTFDTDSCAAGLNFTDVDDAQVFRDAVQSTLHRRQNRKTDKKTSSITPSSSSTSLNVPMTKPNSTISKSMTNLPVEVKKSRKEKAKKPKKLTKDDIGIPTGFQHVGHVGWDPNKGYDINNLDPNLKTLFDHAGVSSEELNDRDTAEFIYDFIEKRGGVDAVKQEQRKVASPPPQISRSKAPPPPPSRGPVPKPPPPPGPARGNAPPPPPPPPVGGPVPPPPPPIATPGPATTNQARKPAAPSLNSALQDEIQRGKKLNPVDASQKKPTGRSALLSDIQNQNFGLKPASVVEDAEIEPAEEGLAGALARALIIRNRQIHSDAEDESSEEDDEFDDDN